MQTRFVKKVICQNMSKSIHFCRVQLPRACKPAAGAGLGVVAVSVLMSYWLTLPLRELADGARRLFVTSESGPVPETGTREVRMLAGAINELLQLRWVVTGEVE